jgi:uncharacterized membrane protein
MIWEVVVAFFTFLIIDFFWIMFISKKFYLKEFRNIANIKKGSIKAKLIPVLILYIIMAFGLVFFALTSGSLIENILQGAFLGFVIYSVYDLTNYSILKSYSLKLTLIDMVWGTVLSGICSAIVSLIFL